MPHLKRMLLFLLFASFVFVSITTSSQTNEAGEWFCINASDIRTFEFQQNGVILNNFEFRERGAWLSENLEVIDFSYFVINQSNVGVHLNVQLVGIDKNNNPVWALQADPTDDWVPSHSSEKVDVDSYISNSLIGRTNSMCMLILLD